MLFRSDVRRFGMIHLSLLSGRPGAPAGQVERRTPPDRLPACRQASRCSPDSTPCPRRPPAPAGPLRAGPSGAPPGPGRRGKPAPTVPDSVPRSPQNAVLGPLARVVRVQYRPPYPRERNVSLASSPRRDPVPHRAHHVHSRVIVRPFSRYRPIPAHPRLDSAFGRAPPHAATLSLFGPRISDLFGQPRS